MADKSKIEWTDATWNIVTGCSKVSQGCKNCYAERGWARLSANPKTVYYGRKFTDVKCHPERLDQPIRWKKPRRIFVNSMSDLFHECVPFDFIADVFWVMRCSKNHVFQILTKRPERMLEFYDFAKTSFWPLPNVWIGVSVEDQETADERIPLLRDTPAAVRWLSMEPLLGQVDLSSILNQCDRVRCGLQDDPLAAALLNQGIASGNADAIRYIDWVVVGGESGPNARPTHPDWVRSIRDECLAANVPFFFKQWGEWAPREIALQVYGKDYDPNNDVEMAKVGKKSAGRLLDGVTWDGMPE